MSGIARGGPAPTHDGWTTHRPTGTDRPALGVRRHLALLGLWSGRHLRTRFRGSVLGVAWNLVQPVAVLAIYGFVFSRFLGADGGDLPYLSAAWAGVVAWTFVQGSWQYAASSFLFDGPVVSKIWFPHHVLPLAPVVAGLVDLAVGLALLVGLAATQGITPTTAVLALPLPVLVLVVWGAALAAITAPVAVFVRDVPTVVTLAVRLGFIITPVVYVASAVPSQYQWLVTVNPFAVAIEGIRSTVLAGAPPDVLLCGVHLAIGTAALLAGLWYGHRVADRVVDAL